MFHKGSLLVGPFDSSRRNSLVQYASRMGRTSLRGIPDRLQRQLGVGTEEIVMFIQMSGRYHDGVRFANGQELLLQRLLERQRADVLSISSTTLSEEETDTVEVRSSAIDWLTLS